MKKCPECGWPVPFLGCPQCPPHAMTCPKCGYSPIWVDPMDNKDFEDILKIVSVEDAVNLGDFKPKKESIL